MTHGLPPAGLALLVLAQVGDGRVRGIRDSFGRHPAESGAIGDWLLIVLLSVVALLLAFAWIQSRGMGKPVRHSRQLFDESLRALGLTSDDKALMKRMAREMRTTHPMNLLLNVHEFDGTANEWIERYPNRDRERLVRKLQTIRRRAFSR